MSSASTDQTYLSSACVQHPQILPSHDVDQLARLDVSNLNEIGLESQNIGVIKSKCLWRSLPLDLPILSGSPAVAVDKE